MTDNHAPVGPVRCAVYTRKSSEEGLDQAFNSLDAQREAGSDYIRSQKHAGWVALPDNYDDGGYSGGSTDRPGLQRLLQDIALGRVDVVVVYKVDRLSRSLADFARLMQLFDEKGVSFVSVTQQFNTTTSMGRLTLNMLLSFAQFEREVAGERIRDKIAATFRKGIFVTGQPPFGYRRPSAGEKGAAERTLLIVPEEARVVRAIFEGYVELGSLVQLAARLSAAGHTTRRSTSRSGRTRGGRSISTGFLYKALNNPIYIGKITHTRRLAGAGVGTARAPVVTEVHDGRHEAIIDRALWDRVQAKMVKAQRSDDRRWTHTHLLKGKIRTFEGHAMSPGSTQRPRPARGGDGEVRPQRYYVSQKAIKLGYASCPIRSLNAGMVDDLVRAAVIGHLGAVHGIDLGSLEPAERDQRLREVVQRVEIAPERVVIELIRSGVDALKTSGACTMPPRATHRSDGDHRTSPPSGHARRFTPAVEERGSVVALVIAIQIKRHDGRRLLLGPDGKDLCVGRVPGSTAGPREHLVRAIGLAYAVREQLMKNGIPLREVAKQRRVALSRLKLLLPLTRLSPSIVKAALTGGLSVRITLKDLLAAARHIDWRMQEALVGMDQVD